MRVEKPAEFWPSCESGEIKTGLRGEKGSQHLRNQDPREKGGIEKWIQHSVPIFPSKRLLFLKLWREEAKEPSRKQLNSRMECLADSLWRQKWSVEGVALVNTQASVNRPLERCSRSVREPQVKQALERLRSSLSRLRPDQTRMTSCSAACGGWGESSVKGSSSTGASAGFHTKPPMFIKTLPTIPQTGPREKTENRNKPTGNPDTGVTKYEL